VAGVRTRDVSARLQRLQRSVYRTDPGFPMENGAKDCHISSVSTRKQRLSLSLSLSLFFVVFESLVDEEFRSLLESLSDVE
jgi:hypothetical protein